MEANHRFAAAPVAASIEGVSGSDERVYAVAGDATDSPHAPADGAGGPCRYAGWIIYRHAYQPAMKEAAIRHTPISNIKNVTHDAERRSLLLDRSSEGYAIVCSCRAHVHGPAAIDVACIHINGKDEMFLSLAAVGRSHCVQKQRARGEIDNRRADDAHGIKLSA